MSSVYIGLINIKKLKFKSERHIEKEKPKSKCFETQVSTAERQLPAKPQGNQPSTISKSAENLNLIQI